MSLTDKQIKDARAYNVKLEGQRWTLADLADDELRGLAVDSDAFAQRVAVVQAEEDIYVDGKLGPRTAQALIERAVEVAVKDAETDALLLGWWSPGEDWPSAEAIAQVSPPLAGEPLDQYLGRMGIRHFSAYELTRLHRWGRNVEPIREDWPNIVPTLRLAEILRYELGGDPLLTLGGYRPRRYVKAIGGSKGSLHIFFRAIMLGLDTQEDDSPAEQRKLYEVAARLFAFYGQDLAMGVGFDHATRGARVTIDTGYKTRSWQAGYVEAVLHELGLSVAPAAKDTPPGAPPVWAGAGVPQKVFDAALQHKYGRLVSVDAGAGQRYYEFEKGVVHYTPVSRELVEVRDK